MNRQVWESQFSRLLKQKLGITPGQVRFQWSTCFSQGQTPEQAIAFLERLHGLYPNLEVLPNPPKATKT